MADHSLVRPVRSFLTSKSNLWLLLGCLIAVHYLLVIHVSFGSPVQVSIAFLVWWGAWLCSEDLIAIEQPMPARGGILLGTLVLVLCIIRGGNTLHPDKLLTLLAPVEGVALAILHQPFHRLGHFKSSLYILSLLPLHEIFFKLLSLPERQINRVTAAASGLFLRLTGKQVTVDGTDVLLPTGGVTVQGPCNGTDMICLLLVVAIIFLICFPLRKWRHRLLVFCAAPLAAMTCNTLRIALLTLIAADASLESDVMFDFFHKEMGSLLFSGVAVSVIAVLYLALLRNQFSTR